ncbi:MAG: hypothetical protein OEV40_01875 [Acidimicrobiia bacterium]|nr:hypothetical protein [Acidimicrobiia bacterium]
MTPVAAVTIFALVVAVAALARAGYVLLHIGSDVHAAGPWTRPHQEPPRTRLPADLGGLWSLFGLDSLQRYPGSWEAAVRRLDTIEESLTGRPANRSEAPIEPSEEWLHHRVAELEALIDNNPVPPPVRSPTAPDWCEPEPGAP